MGTNKSISSSDQGSGALTDRVLGIPGSNMISGNQTLFRQKIEIGRCGLEAWNEYHYLPPRLRPTKIQITTPHHPWLDFFPLPQMRDNLIPAGDKWDEDALCQDIMGFWTRSSNPSPEIAIWGGTHGMFEIGSWPRLSSRSGSGPLGAA
jgi:hypothetical protein